MFAIKKKNIKSFSCIDTNEIFLIKSKRKTVGATDEKCKLVVEEPLNIQNYLLVKNYIWENIDEYEYTILSLTYESDIKKYLDGKTHYATSSVLIYENRALNIREYTVC